MRLKKMNYQKITIKDKELFFDADLKRTACKDCGDLIRFGQDSTGKYYPLNSNGLELHRCIKKTGSVLEDSIFSEERNQEYLNNL